MNGRAEDGIEWRGKYHWNACRCHFKCASSFFLLHSWHTRTHTHKHSLFQSKFKFSSIISHIGLTQWYFSFRFCPLCFPCVSSPLLLYLSSFSLISFNTDTKWMGPKKTFQSAHSKLSVVAIIRIADNSSSYAIRLRFNTENIHTPPNSNQQGNSSLRVHINKW